MAKQQQVRGQTEKWRTRVPEKLLHQTKQLKERSMNGEINRKDERRKREKTPALTGDVNVQTLKKIKEMIKRKRTSRVKRNAMWFSFFGGDEEEEENEDEEEEDQQVVVSSGNRAIPPPTSPRAEVVDYLRFIEVSQDTYSKVMSGYGRLKKSRSGQVRSTLVKEF